MERLVKPTIKSMLKIHNIYIIQKNDGISEELSPNFYSGKSIQNERVRCESIIGNLYLLEIVDENDSPTGEWIKLTHEDYDRDYDLVESVTAKRMLEKLSKEFKPQDVKF